MIELFPTPNYDFIGKRKWAYIVSITITLIGIASIVAHGGLRYDIDFTGGTLAQVRFERAPSVAQIRTALSKVGLGDAVIQRFGDPNEFLIRVGLTSTTPEEVGRRLQSALAADQGLGKFEIRRVEFVGPQVGRDLQLQAIYAVLAAEWRAARRPNRTALDRCRRPQSGRDPRPEPAPGPPTATSGPRPDRCTAAPQA